MKTSELTGTALDWAVCKANGEHQHPYDEYTPTWMANRRYSEDWAQGGPIIEREGICLKYEVDPYMRWTATWRKIEMTTTLYSASPLIAAMRCYVASKLGDEIEIPQELTPVKPEKEQNMQSAPLKQYEICVVSKEYRWIKVFAGDEEEAKDKVWDEIACGFIGDNKPEDTGTDLYVEGIVNDEE